MEDDELMAKIVSSLQERMHLDHTSLIPLHRQIYQWIHQAILEGQLPPGQRLPSTRMLASELGVSRNTASNAYEQLQAEGYLERTVGSGTRVASFFDVDLANHSATLKETPHASALDSSAYARVIDAQMRRMPHFMMASRSSPPRAFRLGTPALDRFPHHQWAQLLTRHAHRSLAECSDYQDAAGYRPLREAIAAHIAITRGVRCQADQIVITSGAQAAIDLAVRLFVERNDTVWMEDPGYPGAQAVFECAGAHLVSVPVHDDGIQVEHGRMISPHARLAYVTPSHQFPLGVTMSLPQRMALLHWAREANAWILEDDYDSEYRYGSRPLEALQGLDRAQRVIYIGTFSKVLFPSLRLGYMVVPVPLMDMFAVAQRFQNTHPPMLEQIALADFLAEGHFARHLRRMRALYMARRDALINAIRGECGSLLEVHTPLAGMHLTGWLPPAMIDTQIEHCATTQGIEVVALSTLSRQPLRRGGLVLGFAACSEQEIEVGVRILGRVLHDA